MLMSLHIFNAIHKILYEDEYFQSAYFIYALSKWSKYQELKQQKTARSASSKELWTSRTQDTGRNIICSPVPRMCQLMFKTISA